MGLVSVVEGGREVRADVYEYEDSQAMIARYAELGGGQGPLGDRPPERYLASWIRAHAARDMNRLAHLTADPTVLDHRSLGWEQLLGEKHAADAVRSGWEVTAFFHLEVDQVLACDDRVIAARIAWRGSMLAGGGLFEIPAGLVVRVESGLAVGWDLYEPEDREAMLARFAELGGKTEPSGRAPERFHAEYARRWAMRDLDALLELYADDWVMVDHRSLGMEPASGIEAARALLASTLSMSPDLRLEVDEVVASDDRVTATRVGLRGHATDGSGEAELLVGYVNRVIEERLVRTELYEPEDRQAMIARYAELGGGLTALGDREPERWVRRFALVHATRDYEGLPELYDDGYQFVDHRTIGWGSIGSREEAVERVKATLAGSTDVRLEVDEVLACDDRVIALRMRWEGSGAREVGGGRFTLPLCAVTVVTDGRVIRSEWFEPEDREAALALYRRQQTSPGPTT